MLASIKSSLKSFGNKSIDTHVRPPVHSRATQELEHVRAQLIARLPAELKLRTIEAARDYVEGDDGAGMSALVAKFIRRNLLDSPDGGAKLDEVIARVTEQLTPKIIEASDHLDERATEAGIRELKEALHLIPDQDGDTKRDRALQEDLDRALDEPEDPMAQELARFWPALAPAADAAPRGERLACKTRVLVRKLTNKILPKIMRSVPDILQNAILALVEKEVREEFEELRSSKWSGAWLDKMFDKAEDKAVRMQRTLLDSFMDSIWEKGVKDKCIEETVELLVEFEDKVAGEVRGAADKFPF